MSLPLYQSVLAPDALPVFDASQPDVSGYDSNDAASKLSEADVRQALDSLGRPLRVVSPSPHGIFHLIRHSQKSFVSDHTAYYFALIALCTVW